MKKLGNAAQIVISSWLISRGSTEDQNWLLVSIGLAIWIHVVLFEKNRTRFTKSFLIWYLAALISLDWLLVLGIDAWFALSLLVAVYWVFGIYIFTKIEKYLNSLYLRIILLSLIAVMVDFISGHIPFGGFNWLRLAYLWSDSPLSEISYWLGLPALTSIAVLVSSVLTIVNRAKVKALSLCLLFILINPLLSNIHQRSLNQNKDSTKVLAIQGSVPQVGLDFNAQRAVVFNNHLQHTRIVMNTLQEKPDLILWPENSVDIDPYQNFEIGEAIVNLSRELDVPLIFGAVLREDDGLKNAALLTEGEGIETVYEKRKLVPFGEYLPFRNILAPLVTRFDRLSVDFQPGSNSNSVSFGKNRLGLLICYEVAFDPLWQNYGNNSDYLFVMTNNATYGGTKQPWQQLNISKAQAIANGQSVVVVSTSGISGYIDAQGEVSQLITKNEPGYVLVDVPKSTSKAPSISVSIFFPILALLIISILLARNLIERLRSNNRLSKNYMISDNSVNG